MYLLIYGVQRELAFQDLYQFVQVSAIHLDTRSGDSTVYHGSCNDVHRGSYDKRLDSTCCLVMVLMTTRQRLMLIQPLNPHLLLPVQRKENPLFTRTLLGQKIFVDCGFSPENWFSITESDNDPHMSIWVPSAPLGLFCSSP